MYVPWSNKRAIWVKTNMVWIAPAEETHDALPEVAHSIYDTAGTKYNVTPMLWADSSLQALQNTIKGVVHEVADEITAMSPDQRMHTS